MSKPIIKDHNVETGEITEREMTKAEFDSWQKGNELKAKQEADALAAKSALLDRLGITEDEAKLLLA